MELDVPGRLPTPEVPSSRVPPSAIEFTYRGTEADDVDMAFDGVQEEIREQREHDATHEKV